MQICNAKGKNVDTYTQTGIRTYKKKSDDTSNKTQSSYQTLVKSRKFNVSVVSVEFTHLNVAGTFQPMIEFNRAVYLRNPVNLMLAWAIGRPWQAISLIRAWAISLHGTCQAVYQVI